MKDDIVTDVFVKPIIKTLLNRCRTISNLRLCRLCNSKIYAVKMNKDRLLKPHFFNEKLFY